MRDSDQVSVGDIMCEPSVKPGTSTARCTMEDCPVVYLWKVEHEPCSVTCGQGESVIS